MLVKKQPTRSWTTSPSKGLWSSSGQTFKYQKKLG